jgi:hypothetical protein
MRMRKMLVGLFLLIGIQLASISQAKAEEWETCVENSFRCYGSWSLLMNTCSYLSGHMYCMTQCVHAVGTTSFDICQLY